MKRSISQISIRLLATALVCIASVWWSEEGLGRTIGVVAPGFGADSEEAQAFRDGLRAAGYVEGRDVSIDWWSASGSYSGVDDAIARMVRSKVDVIVVESTLAASAAKRATQTIPIVMALVGDPEGTGLVKSLGRPGGNITGLTNMTQEVTAKRLELLKETVPSATRVGVLWNPATPSHKAVLASLSSVAPNIRVKLVLAPVSSVGELGPAFSALTRSKVGAVIALDDPFVASNGTAIAQLALKSRLPLALAEKRFAKDGALVAYGTDLRELFRRAAEYVDKILRGDSPATLPVEQPTRFDMVISLRTARTLGLTIPESVLLQATEVIK